MSDRISPPSIAAIKRVVSVCEKKDIRVWKIASGRIIRNIAAESYQLICPDSQIGEFMGQTHPGWEIVGESQYSADCAAEMIRTKVSGENASRVNWLFQQFVKLNAIARSELDESDIVLIWDADTVPLRRLSFVNPTSGALMFYHSRERHEPYFRTISALLGFGRQTEVSFIAQCFPVRAGWVREMLGEIEARSGKPYVEAVLGCLPGESGAEFSEYETIGSWLIRHHPGEIEFRNGNRWLRDGSSVLPADPSGATGRIMLHAMAAMFDFVAIENWKGQINWRRLPHRIRRLLIRGG